MWQYQCTSPPELYHHGIQGMKWGIRRYQNKDGSLTKAGKRKALKDADVDVPKKKSLKDMSDEEIISAINRKNLEDRYKSAFPAPKNKGAEIAKTLLNQVIAPAAIGAGKKLAEGLMSKAVENILRKGSPKTDTVDSFVEKVGKMSADQLKTYKDVATVAEAISKVKKIQGDKKD